MWDVQPVAFLSPCVFLHTCKNNSNSSHQTLVTHAILDIVEVSAMMESFSCFFSILHRDRNLHQQILSFVSYCVDKDVSPKKYSDQCQVPERKKDTFVAVSNRQEKDDFVVFFLLKVQMLN